MSTPPRHVRRLAEADDWGLLVRAADDVEPPAGARDRIWRALENAHAPLAHDSDAVAHLVVRAVREAGPADGARERVWQALATEALARSGAAEPARLVDSDPALRPVLVATTEAEPPIGSRARLLCRVEPRRAPAFGLAAMALAAALALVLLRPATPPPAPTSSAATAAALPSLAVNIEKGLEKTGTNPGALAAGDALVLTGAAPARFHVAGVGEVVLAGRGARLTLARHDADGVELALSGGLVAIHAEKRRRESPLTVVAGDTRVQVVGTIFAVEAQGTGANVAVHEGLVAVTRGAEEHRLGAGQGWRMGEPPDRAPPSHLAAALLAGLTGDTAAAATATTPVEAQPAATAAPLAAKPALVAARPTAPPSNPVVAPAVAALPARAAVEPARPARFELAAAARPYMGRAAEALRELAREAGRRGDFTGELGALYALAHAPQVTREESASALTQAAMLADVELGAPLEALEAWRTLERGHDTAAEEARFRVVMLAVELGRTEEALVAADECRRACAPDRREIALYARAVALRETPEYGAALKEARAAAPDALVTAARTFAHRALELRFQQPERAAKDARIAARLDPAGLAPEIRALARP